MGQKPAAPIFFNQIFNFGISLQILRKSAATFRSPNMQPIAAKSELKYDISTIQIPLKKFCIMSVSSQVSRAKSLLKKGQIEEAILIYLDLIHRFPKNLSVKKELLRISRENRTSLSHPPQNALQSMYVKHQKGELKEAYFDARGLAQSFPKSSLVLSFYGAICAELGLLPEAEQALHKALILEPASAQTCNNLGKMSLERNALQDAIRFYELALIFDPKFVTAQLNLGKAHLELRNFKQAESCFRNAIQTQPKSGPAYRYLSQITTFLKNDPMAQQIKALLQTNDVSDFDRSELHFAYAKACEDIHDYDCVFNNLEAGGHLKQKIFNYNKAQDDMLFSESAQELKQLDDVALPNQDPYAGPLPIFILGMPRSGTSLVEQIISAHSTVQAGGERPTVDLLCKKLFSSDKQPTPKDLEKFRASYLTSLFPISQGRRFVTDKMPQNFMHIGAIRKAIPEAKIVLVTRDAKATCWSNFKHCFESKQMAFSFRLEDTVSYYLNYVELMRLVQERHGQATYQLNYENLTSDPHAETSKLLEYLNLPNEEACFAPHENKNISRTASQLQVQKKIYTGSSSAWKAFETHTRKAFSLLEAPTAVKP